jgi:NTP pyrophosphatase (non-canonical NTP hydrolase)
MSITIKEYQEFTPTTFVVPMSVVDARESYLFSGLAAEAGEVAGNYAKYCRGDFHTQELVSRTKKELGDVLYFTFQLANWLNLDVEEILETNRSKLQDRMNKGKIKGDGEDR